MSMYRTEWPCCGDVSETNAYVPESCPFCTGLTPLQKAAPDLLDALQVALRQNQHDMLMTGEELRSCEAAIEKAVSA